MLGYLIQDSQLSLVKGGWTFDVFSGPETLLLVGVLIMAMVSVLQYLEEGIGGPLKGRESIPLGNTRFGGSLLATFAYIGLIPVIPAVFYDHNVDAFNEVVAPGLLTFNGLNQAMSFITEAFNGFGMLVATLLFEKKIDQKQSGALLFIIFFASGLFDIVGALVPSDVDALPPAQALMNTYNDGVVTKFHVNEFFGVLYAITVVRGFWRLFHGNPDNEANDAGLSHSTPPEVVVKKTIR